MASFTPTIKPTIKQDKAWMALQDKTVKYLLFGGGGGGGKSWLGCEWLMVFCLMYPGTKWFIGREELKRLRESTLLTFWKVLSFHKIPSQWYKYNGQDNFIQFTNGSRIDLLDLRYNPSDPLYERYGSAEYTGGWIEEGGEVAFEAFDTLKSRVGRHKNEEYGIASKILITANPKKNWLYSVFYKPFRQKELPIEYGFIQALVDDNPYGEKDYKTNLISIADVAKKERLLYGNWEYDDDPSALIRFEAILDLFSNKVPDDRQKYLVADIARYGRDKTVISYWEGLACKNFYVYEKQGTDQTANALKALANNLVVPFSHILVDEDGIGGGVVDQMRGIHGFVANATPFELPNGKKDNYANLKAQCGFMMAEYVNDHKISVETKDVKIKSDLIAELEQVKSQDVDKEKKLRLMPKEKIKEILGRSPDFSDVLLMRLYFEIRPVRGNLAARAFTPQARTYSKGLLRI